MPRTNSRFIKVNAYFQRLLAVSSQLITSIDYVLLLCPKSSIKPESLTAILHGQDYDDKGNLYAFMKKKIASPDGKLLLDFRKQLYLSHNFFKDIYSGKTDKLDYVYTAKYSQVIVNFSAQLAGLKDILVSSMYSHFCKLIHQLEEALMGTVKKKAVKGEALDMPKVFKQMQAFTADNPDVEFTVTIRSQATGNVLLLNSKDEQEQSDKLSAGMEAMLSDIEAIKEKKLKKAKMQDKLDAMSDEEVELLKQLLLKK